VFYLFPASTYLSPQVLHWPFGILYLFDG